MGKYDDSRDLIGCSGLSKTQKVQRIHQIECSYASIMLSLRYCLCLFYTNYDSTNKQCCVVSCSPVYFLPPQIMGTIQAIGWEVQFCQHFRGSREFMRFKFLYASFMISLHYRSCGFYKDYAMTKMSPKNLCYVNTMLLCLFML